MDCNNVNLNTGSTGAQVKELQKYLTYLSYYDGKIDGNYGNYTLQGVKRLQSAYSLVVDGNFGPKSCKACGINGQSLDNTIQTIQLDTFKNIIQRYNNYKTTNNKEPKLMYIDISNKYRYISLAKYKEMKQRYDKYIETNKKEPNYMYINKPGSNSITTSTYTIIEKMQDAIGKFSNIKEAYNLCRGRGYGHYNDDIYDQATSIKRLKNRQGINCSDSCQLFYALAKAYGLEARFVHIVCKSGAGHIVLDVKYPKSNNSYTRIDPAACLSTGSQYSWGRIWCSNGRVIAYNDSWLMTDNGRT